MEYNRAYVFTNAGAKKGNSKIKAVEKFLSRLPSSLRPPYQIYPTLGVNSDSDSPLLRFVSCIQLTPSVLVVVAIDANHCPGSCMFSFSLYEGSKLTDMENIFSMLYTGDFRISPPYFVICAAHEPVSSARGRHVLQQAELPPLAPERRG